MQLGGHRKVSLESQEPVFDLTFERQPLVDESKGVNMTYITDVLCGDDLPRAMVNS